MPPATNRETNRTLSGSALRQPQRTSRVFMKEWNQSLIKVVACATLLLSLASCSGGGSDGGGTPQVAVTSGTSFLSSPVRITFSVTNFTIGLPGTPHLRFSIDGGAPHDFYNGAGIDSNNGVLLNGLHTHFVHWTSRTSFDLFALSAGPHQVRLVLVDAANTELTNAGAATIHNFMVQQPPIGDLHLESVLDGLDFPVGLSQAQDGRVFFNERLTGNFHNGGIIQFGPDGKLYIVIGDVGTASNAADKTSLAGKILRVNPADGSGLSDNPFFGSGNVNQDRVFSYGHRNSYGFTFHPQTQDLWESENGENDNDEINRIVAGGNYGWDSNQRMGMLNNPCCIDPIAVFFPLPCTICVIAPTGIIAIPGNSFIYPQVFRNNLLVAAFIDGTIRLVTPDGTNPDLPGTTSVA